MDGDPPDQFRRDFEQAAREDREQAVELYQEEMAREAWGREEIVRAFQKEDDQGSPRP
jgi:hypothetical protein